MKRVLSDFARMLRTMFIGPPDDMSRRPSAWVAEIGNATNTHDILISLVHRIRCKPGWYFRIAEENGFKRLVITVGCRGVENHELGEWFRVGKERPFSPLHGPGENPYVVHEFRPDIDARTTQDGSVREHYEDY